MVFDPQQPVTACNVHLTAGDPGSNGDADRSASLVLNADTVPRVHDS